METTYYSFDARKIKVSGGADLLTFVPASVPTPVGEEAQILDFDRCRRHLETKRAWKDLAARVEEEPEEEFTEEFSAPRPRRERRERAATLLELAATAAVLLVSLAAAAAFFSLL